MLTPREHARAFRGYGTGTRRAGVRGDVKNIGKKKIWAPLPVRLAGVFLTKKMPRLPSRQRRHGVLLELPGNWELVPGHITLVPGSSCG